MSIREQLSLTQFIYRAHIDSSFVTEAVTLSKISVIITMSACVISILLTLYVALRLVILRYENAQVTIKGREGVVGTALGIFSQSDVYWCS